MNTKQKGSVLQRWYTDVFHVLMETAPGIMMADIQAGILPGQECSAALACLLWYLLRRARIKSTDSHSESSNGA